MAPLNSKNIVNFIINLIVYYFLAATLEFIIIFIFLRLPAYQEDIVVYKLFTSILFINIITYLPTQIYVWVFLFLNWGGFFIYVIIAEIIVVYLEYGLLFDKIKEWVPKYRVIEREIRLKTLSTIIIANFLSFIVGFIPIGIYPSPVFEWPLTNIFTFIRT